VATIDDTQARMELKQLKNSLFQKAFNLSSKRSEPLIELIKDNGLFEEYLVYCNSNRFEKPRRRGWRY
jgi:hypothetical protein